MNDTEIEDLIKDYLIEIDFLIKYQDDFPEGRLFGIYEYLAR